MMGGFVAVGLCKSDFDSENMSIRAQECCGRVPREMRKRLPRREVCVNNRQTARALLGSILLVAAVVGYRTLWGYEPAAAPSPAAAPVPPADREERVNPPVGTPVAESERAPLPRTVSTELLAVLRACMASLELRPAPGASPVDLRLPPGVLEDCLRGSDSLDILSRLSQSLSALEDRDREDAVLLMGYLARRLLSDLKESPTAERAAVIRAVLEGYHTVEGPHLERMLELLLVRAYVRKGDLRGVAREIQLALERELEAGAVSHVLGPLLGASSTALSTTTDPFGPRVPGRPRAPNEAIDAMEGAVERAVPQAIELSLEAMLSKTPPHELRDALLLLQNAFFAIDSQAKPVREAVPRILDSLAQLDLKRIQESGVELAVLDGLVSQTELRLLKTGLSVDQVPPGGRTSPADLRRRWMLGEALSRQDEHKLNKPPEFR
jgi:hypothetical protein